MEREELDKKIFLNFDKDFEHKYKFLNDKKNLKNIFQFQLRLFELKEHDTANSNLKKIIRRQFSFSFFFRHFLILFTKIFGIFFKKRNFFFRSNVSTSEFDSLLKNKLSEKQFDVIGTTFYQNNFKGNKNYLTTFTWIFDIFERSLEVVKILKKKNCSDIYALIDMLESTKFRETLDFAYIQDYNFAVKILKNLNIHGVLINSDQTISGNIFIEAAKKIKVRTAILAHGNFRNPYLCGVLPLHADKIFVWSKKTEKHINECLDEKRSQFIEGIKLKIIKRKSVAKKILFVASPFKIVKSNNYVDNFIKIIKSIKELSQEDNFIFCPHPSEKDKDLFKILSNLQINISKKTYEEAKAAKLVIGTHSSFLFESHNSGIQTVQIRDLCSNPKQHQAIEGIPQLNFEKIINEGYFHNDYYNYKNVQEKINIMPIVNFFI